MSASLVHARTHHTSFSPCHRSYPSLLDGGLAYTADLKCTAARLLSPPVDERALADVTRDGEAQRTHVAAMCSAGGKASMASEHAPRIQSAGGKASMASEHAPRIQSAGGQAGLGRKKGIYKKPHQTAAQAANAEYMRKYRVAKR